MAILLLLTGSFQAVRAQDQPEGHGAFTDIRIDGTTVVIVINLTVVLGSGEEFSPEGEAYVREGFAAAQAFWNAAFGRAGACPSFRLELNVRFGEEGEEDAPGHNVYLREHAGVLPDGRGLPTVEFPGLSLDTPGTTDIVDPYDGVASAYLPEWIFQDPWALAHELGHLMGLGDDYHDGEVVPGRDGTLMAGTLGGDYVDGAILDDIADIARQAGYRLPECWEGTIEMTDDELNPSCSAVTMSARFTLGVGEDGSATGSGTFEHSGYTCEGGFTAPSTTGTFETVAQRTAEGFTGLESRGFSMTSEFTPRLPIIGNMEIPVEEGAGEGDFHPFPGVTYHVTLECPSCESPGQG